MQMGQNETFRTIIKSVHSDFNISHAQSVMCMGSCFADHIGELLKRHKFSVSINPYGVLFNPLSIADSLQRMLHPKPVTEDTLFYHGDCWSSYAFHSRFSHPDKNCCLRKIQQGIDESHNFLQHADYLFITLGSNVVYRLKSSGEVVANCHKRPAVEFEKQALSVEEMEKPFESLLTDIRKIRPGIRIILTVSPVRYIKNDFTENSYSKACLRILVHELCQKHEWVSYFPAYEILMDDLRDYRFYAADRVHPSEEAIAYIWDYFSETYFTEESLILNRQIEEVRTAYQHRVQFPQTEAFQNFCRQSLEKISRLQSLHPALDFSEEKIYFEQFIH